MDCKRAKKSLTDFRITNLSDPGLVHINKLPTEANI